MRRAALVGTVDFNAEHYANQDIHYTIAVDGGYAQLERAGIKPDIALGDFDSLGYVPTLGSTRVFPPIKDETDMELACRAAREEGCDELLLYGCLSRRLDHTIANLQLLAGLASFGVRAFGIGDAFAITALSAQGVRRIDFEAFDPTPLDGGSYGRCISVFACGGPADCVTERGLAYTLDHETLRNDISRGVSNEFTGTEASVLVESGSLLVCFPLGAWEHIQR